jgi:hypothetical protein
MKFVDLVTTFYEFPLNVNRSLRISYPTHDADTDGRRPIYPALPVFVFDRSVFATVDLIKGWNIEWPRLEADDFIMAIGSSRPLEDATRIAYRELIRRIAAEYGYDQWDACMMLSQCGKVRLGNFVDAKYTIGAAAPKEYL